MFKTIVHNLLAALGVVLLTFGTWYGLNWVKSYRQAQQDQAAVLNAVVQLLQYNLQQGTLKTVPPGQPSDVVQPGHARPAPDAAR